MPWSLEEYLKLIPVSVSVIQSSPGAPWTLAGLVPWPGQGKFLGSLSQWPTTLLVKNLLQCPVWTCPDSASLHSLTSAAGHQRGEISTSPPLLPLRKVQRDKERRKDLSRLCVRYSLTVLGSAIPRGTCLTCLWKWQPPEGNFCFLKSGGSTNV